MTHSQSSALLQNRCVVVLLCALCAGEDLVCSMSVVNTGTVGLKTLSADNAACTDLPISLAPGQSANRTVSRTAQQADFDGWDTSAATFGLAVTVTANATATMQQSSASDVADVSVTLVSAPGVTLVSKSTNVSAADYVAAGKQAYQLL